MAYLAACNLLPCILDQYLSSWGHIVPGALPEYSKGVTIKKNRNYLSVLGQGLRRSTWRTGGIHKGKSCTGRSHRQKKTEKHQARLEQATQTLNSYDIGTHSLGNSQEMGNNIKSLPFLIDTESFGVIFWVYVETEGICPKFPLLHAVSHFLFSRSTRTLYRVLQLFAKEFVYELFFYVYMLVENLKNKEICRILLCHLSWHHTTVKVFYNSTW